MSDSKVMKHKIIFILIGFLCLLICFTTSIKLRDYFYEQNLRNNLHKIEVGMDEQKVLKILGKPTNVMSSDSPSRYWCYETDSTSQMLEDQPEIHCGKMLLEMSSSKDGKVVKVFDF